MKLQVIKYRSEVGDIIARCMEEDCTRTARVHVCFEDGSGRFVCDSCLENHINAGEWITDSAELLLAS